MLKMLPPSEMMDLILQSIEESDLFRSDWDRGFVKVVLELFLTLCTRAHKDNCDHGFISFVSEDKGIKMKMRTLAHKPPAHP